MSESFLTYRRDRWLWFGLVSAVLLIISYIPYREQIVPHGGTAMGLAYGVLGTGVILVLMSLGIRKRRLASGLGTVQGWTSAHVYLGLLTLLLIPMHAGFKFRPDIHSLGFLLLLLVVLSGIVGVILYRTIPPLLTNYETRLQAHKADEQISLLVGQMRSLANNKTDAFVQVYQEEVRKLTNPGHQGWRLLLKGPRGDALTTSVHGLANVVTRIPQHEQADFRAFSGLILQKVELEALFLAHLRLKNVLEAWLFVHRPLSIAMVVAIVLNVGAVFYY